MIMDGHKNSSSSCLSLINRSERWKMMMRKCKEFHNLPDEMLFNILLKLPVEDIYEVMRFVCWKWYHMIRTRNFVYEHLKQHRSNGLLIQAYRAPSIYPSQQFGQPLTYVSMRPDRSIEIISMVSCKLLKLVWTSCNGLLLQADVVHEKNHNVVSYYIRNPITSQCFSLPKFIPPTGHDFYMQAGLVYVAASKEYKVAFTYSRPKKNIRDPYPEQDCAVFTVGVDNSWRRINTDHLSATARSVNLYSIPLVTEGFLHWYGTDGLVVTLDVETETLKEFLAPRGYGERWKRYLSTGTSYLYFIVNESTELSWEAWEMEPKIGEWTRLPNIVLEDQKHLLAEQCGCSALHLVPVPIGWLKYKEVMVFNFGRGERVSSKYFFAYDVHARKIYPFELGFCMNHSLAHVNSLVYLDG